VLFEAQQKRLAKFADITLANLAERFEKRASAGSER
jgi:hypothetical protein